jgi:hypothetical protein
LDDKNRLFQEVCLRQIQLILTVALGVSEIRWARLLDGGLFNTGLWATYFWTGTPTPSLR